MGEMVVGHRYCDFCQAYKAVVENDDFGGLECVDAHEHGEVPPQWPPR